jgi:hypothetical protein
MDVSFEEIALRRNKRFRDVLRIQVIACPRAKTHRESESGLKTWALCSMLMEGIKLLSMLLRFIAADPGQNSATFGTIKSSMIS